MNRLWLAALPGLAALFCALIMVWLILQIDDARHQLYNDGIANPAIVFTASELEHFDAKVRETAVNRMDELYEALWFCGVTLIITLSFAVSMFIALSRRAEHLSVVADNSQTRLESALNKLSSGDQAREAQNRFFAAASHDLRQPLHALGLYLEALRRHVTSDQGSHILENSCRSAEALNQLLNSMLDLSKLDAGVMEVNLEHLALEDVFHRLHQTFEPTAKERGLELTLKNDGACVHSDPVLLERVLTNLLSNALRYTEIGSVAVVASTTAGKVLISIRDTGCGIAHKEHDTIFDEYYQLHNPERDRTKGLGIGLSIVKRLTPLLNASLTLDSSLGDGSEFVLHLPQGDVNFCANKAIKTPQSSDSDLFGLSILVIDDESDVREGMETLLNQQRCMTISLESAERALRYIVDKDWEPDLIVADYRLRDEKTGSQAVQLIREELNKDIPAMIITGDTSAARLREARDSGFELLHKPVDARQLLKSINRLIGEEL